MKYSVTASILLLAGQAPFTAAWGDLGHQTVAYIASNFVSSTTATFFQDILGDTTTSYLANVATWADTYRYTTAGAYSYPYHFIDALDSPPKTCDVEYSRDCGDTGCSVSAMLNYTNMLLSKKTSAANLQLATKMVVHFVGDMHQPLHDENLDVGGNDIDVTFKGTSTNLHHIWDTNMPEELVGGYTLADAESWATTLTTAISTGTYSKNASAWLTGMDISDPVTSSMIWATDSNAYVCSSVIPEGITYYENKELGGTYYTDAIPVFELQIAKAGYRLAAWLDLIATGSTGL